jgi:hypothetical protein
LKCVAEVKGLPAADAETATAAAARAFFGPRLA